MNTQPTHACPTCPLAFFTGIGLADHVAYRHEFGSRPLTSIVEVSRRDARTIARRVVTTLHELPDDFEWADDGAIEFPAPAEDPRDELLAELHALGQS